MSKTTTTTPAPEKKPKTERVPPSKRAADPELVVPAPTIKTPRIGRFVYVPGLGNFAGTADSWVRNDPKSEEWNALRLSPKLGSFLSVNPMTTVYGQVNADLSIHVTQIVQGGDFLPEKTARAILPFLPWYGDDKPKTKAVVDPDEVGKVPAKK